MELHEDGLKLLSSCSLRAHEDILSWIARNRGRDGVTLAVNAPIIVENMGGQRPCDGRCRHKLLLLMMMRMKLDFLL